MPLTLLVEAAKKKKAKMTRRDFEDEYDEEAPIELRIGFIQCRECEEIVLEENSSQGYCNDCIGKGEE